MTGERWRGGEIEKKRGGRERGGQEREGEEKTGEGR